MLEKQQIFTRLAINLKGVHMSFRNTLAIHGCGTVCESVVGLMEGFATLTLTQVQFIQPMS